METHWIIAPVVLPAILAPLLAWVMRHDIVLARSASLAGAGGLVAIAVGLLNLAAGSGEQVYRLGDWPAPFGITLVLDHLSAAMVLLTSVLGLIVLIHAVATGWDNRGRHFHALFQFQLMGICGAFLTGDAFNLFVFFEILLIASYGLMIHGGGRVRLQAGLQYVVMNLAGSTLFLFALGTLYAATGTLNIADLAVKVREIAPEDAALVRVAAMLLLIVFAIKAAVFPVQFWLPTTYSNAPAPVAALFAVMTKVGAYAILRFYIIVFGPDVAATGTLPEKWLFAGATITTVIGAFGVLGARRLMSMISFSVIFSMGTLMLAISAFTPDATLAALYYLLHSTFATAALFLVACHILARRPSADLLHASPPTVQNGIFAALFFAAAIGMAGMPPLSGFLGKLVVLKALIPWEHAEIAWVVILGGSLVTIVGFARAGSMLFWKSTAEPVTEPEEDAPEPEDAPRPATALALAPAAVCILMMALLSALAGPVTRYLGVAVAQLYDREGYIAAVLTPPEDGDRPVDAGIALEAEEAAAQEDVTVEDEDGLTTGVIEEVGQ
ncbi:monovalent cation/H+ antiporter subunit D [Pseudoroseicyclus sp. CLL3-39]|uniref:Monovalent cation/H+ antiporter subunit D n=1 Tax=Pseudoroseicyclus tamaricis TaxID=2705421 RepID=A0A6B2K2K6_9RHOB|nr:monovalent cation/H+ antiporter subunit D [Pseudoroseicyclus tamaricis]